MSLGYSISTVVLLPASVKEFPPVMEASNVVVVSPLLIVSVDWSVQKLYLSSSVDFALKERASMDEVESVLRLT